MKHFYENIYGWFNCQELYTNIVNQLPNNSHIVEIGAFKGKSCAYMAVEIINSGKNIQYDIIDSWNGEDGSGRPVWSDYVDDVNNNHYKPTGDIFEEFKNNLAPVIKYINPVQALSSEAVKQYENKSLDFIFIDGNHHYEGVMEDLKNWRPKMKDGAIMAGDDYNPPWGVEKAVTEFFGKENIKLVGNGCQWLVQL